MGIRGLTGWIRWAAPETRKAPDWAALKGAKVGVDILGFLYKTKAQRLCAVRWLAQFIAACTLYEIQPVLVFDGKPPDCKRAALTQRSATRLHCTEKYTQLSQEAAVVPMTEGQKSVIDAHLELLGKQTTYFTSEERDHCKQFLYACGVLALNASGEADNVLAYFVRRGDFAAVISNDLDLLARGVEQLLVPDHYALPGDTDGWIQYNLSAILDSSHLSYEQFLEMCVLMGCDYTVGHKSLPYKSAYWAIRYRGALQSTLNVLHVTDSSVYDEAIERLRGTYDTPESLMGEKQWEKWTIGAPPKEQSALNDFRKTTLSKLPQEIYNVLSGGD
jgi:flap endonuclease-1